MSIAVVVQPHYDDAAMSLGQYLTNHHSTTVATVCSAVPHDGRLTQYDADSGFESSRAAMAARRQENRRALAVLDVEAVDLGMTDGAYRDHPLGSETVAAIKGVCQSDTERLVGPLGLCHPDHVSTAAACRLAAQHLGVDLWAYEELPYRVLTPEAVPEALNAIKAEGWEATLGFIGDGPLEIKQAAVRCYRSQLWAIPNEHVLWVPERVWRLTPCG